MNSKHISHKLRPFLKWVGGKAWLVERIRPFLPQDYNRFFEPFLGSGAIYFSLSNGHKSFLSDVNNDLINTFLQVKLNCPRVIACLSKYKNSESDYYYHRNACPNSPTQQAARFIFLNKTCYNGVYRVNRQGKFNVPYCHNNKIVVLDKSCIIEASKSLANANLAACDFESVIEHVKKKDLVFLDPPYTVAHGNNGFIEYNHKLFSWADQERLASFVEKLNSRGAYYILTNAKHKSILELYSNIGNHFELERHNTITSYIDKRNKITEYLFTNCL
jgi:DNA adenine methylase